MTKSDFFSGLAENNRELLLKVPMSDIHNHYLYIYYFLCGIIVQDYYDFALVGFIEFVLRL